MLLKGKTVLVTGGARGIGKGIVLAALAEGASVHYCASGEGPHKSDMDAAVTPGASVVFHKADISDEQQVRDLVRAVTAQGSLDVVVNNAGITRDGLIFRMSREQWDAVLNVNLTGAFLVCREAASFMALKQKSGSIINISSVVAHTGNPGQVNYTASKAGLLGLTRSLSREVASRNVRVNAVSPGFIETDMTSAFDEKTRNDITRAISLGRLGTAQDIAGTVLYLASDLSSYVTGQVIRVDGGLSW